MYAREVPERENGPGPEKLLRRKGCKPWEDTEQLDF